METDLKVFTLNCWGIPGISKDRKLRMKAIGQELATGKYDVVCLQEVWSNTDYEYLKNTLERSLPFAHYFHSGVLGSGICIFSRYRILETFFHRWSVNGYIHKLHHGDWFGGKGVGLCRIQYGHLEINIYSAHLHAEYNRKNDEYRAHRVLQAFYTAQFIRLTSGCAPLIVLAGDLNTEPDDLAYRILLNASGLKDSFLLMPHENSNLFGTNEGSRNSYTPKKIAKADPNGKRIDYVLFKTSSDQNVELVKYEFPLPEFVPDQKCSYSDHEAVQVTFRINSGSVMNSPVKLTDSHITALKESIKVCEESLPKLKRRRICYCVFVFIMIGLLIGTASLKVPAGWDEVIIIVKILVAFIVFYAMSMATFWNCIEVNAIKSGILAMEINLLQMTNTSFETDFKDH